MMGFTAAKAEKTIDVVTSDDENAPEKIYCTGIITTIRTQRKMVIR